MATFLQRRSVMRLALDRAEIEVTENRRATVRRPDVAGLDGVYLDGPTLEDAEVGREPGWLAMYFLPNVMQIVTLVIRENGVVFRVTSHDHPEAILSALDYEAVQTAATEEVRRGVAAIVTELLEKSENLHLRIARESAQVQAAGVYRSVAIVGTDGNPFSELPGVLGNRGLYDLLGRDGDLLTAFVQLSFFPVISDRTRAVVGASLASVNLDLEWALDRLQQCERREGIRLLVPGRNGALWPAV